MITSLQTGLAGKLTLLSAPAGFGKTTLISAWRASAPQPHLALAWLSLDDGDNDAGTFLRYLIAALQTLLLVQCSATGTCAIVASMD